MAEAEDVGAGLLHATLEGEATAHYIADRARALSIRCTRIAHGVPLGGELLATDLRQAQHYLGEITGKITPDDLLGSIFSKFCIGK